MNGGIVDISSAEIKPLNLFPETVTEEIIQNIGIILKTAAGSVPLDRNFGIDSEFIDDPGPRAVMKLAVFVLESIQEHEKRAEVKEIDFVRSPEGALDGRLYPKVKVMISDEYLF